jgi:hypothetical protein
MFDQILQLVKEQIGSSAAITSAVPAQQQDAVNNEIASHVTDKLQAQGAGGMLSMLGGMDINSITVGLADKLSTKFGLSPSVTNAIVAALPGLLQKFTGKGASNGAAGAADILDSLPGGLGSKLGGFFN